MAFIPFAAALGSAAGVSATAAGMMIASTAATVIGTGISAYGMIQQGNIAEQQGNLQARIAQDEANYNAKIDDNNAIRSGYAAIQEQQSADQEIDSLREQRLRALGSQRAALGKSGLTISGSGLDVMSDTAVQFEKEIQMARYRGQVGAFNYAQQAADFRSSANARRVSGRNTAISAAFSGASAKYSSRLSATGTLIGGLAQAGASFASFRGGNPYGKSKINLGPNF